jgi:hypothetical protein
MFLYFLVAQSDIPAKERKVWVDESKMRLFDKVYLEWWILHKEEIKIALDL